ncbi:MAG: hypothetical protein AB4062_05355 [Crocosphaera sp.]
MNNISLEDNRTLEAILNDYQEKLALCLKEIKQVIDLLNSPLVVSGNETQLSEKVALANRMINQTTQRLENLKEHSQLLQGKAHLTELENYRDIRELLSYQLEKVKQKTEQWKYSA